MEARNILYISPIVLYQNKLWSPKHLFKDDRSLDKQYGLTSQILSYEITAITINAKPLTSSFKVVLKWNDKLVTTLDAFHYATPEKKMVPNQIFLFTNFTTV